MSIADWVNGVLIAGIVTGSLYALVALGFTALYRTTLLFNFAHGDLVMWAPMAALVARDLWHLPIVASLAIGIGVPVVLALVAEVSAIRPYISQPGQHLWILSTLGVSVILEQLAAIPFRAQDVSFSIAVSAAPIKLGPIQTSPQALLLVAAAIVSTASVKALYRWTTLGQMLVAVGEDADGARALGISPGRMSQWAMVISGLTAAVAGVSVAPLILVSPTFGFTLVFGGFVAVALGGIGSIIGGLVGGMSVGLLIQLTSALGGSQWSNAVLFGALLMVFLIRPTGLFGVATIRSV